MTNVKIGIWAYILVFVIFMTAHQGWSPTAAIFQYEYEISDPPGQLFSTRNTLYFYVMFSLSLMWWVPLSAALMTSFFGNRTFEKLHLVIVVILFFWVVAVTIFDVIYLVTANPDPYDPTHEIFWFNPATDKRWCCAYQGKGRQCHLSTRNMTCVPFVLPEMLGIDFDFVISFTMNCILVVFLIFDFIWVQCFYFPVSQRIAKTDIGQYIYRG